MTNPLPKGPHEDYKSTSREHVEINQSLNCISNIEFNLGRVKTLLHGDELKCWRILHNEAGECRTDYRNKGTQYNVHCSDKYLIWGLENGARGARSYFTSHLFKFLAGSLGACAV